MPNFDTTIESIDKQSIFDILLDLGYNPKRGNDYFSCAANYRNGDNENALAIYPKKNLVIDFVTGEKFSIQHLIKKTLKLESDEQVQLWVKNKNFDFNYSSSTVDKKPLIKSNKVFDNDILNDLEPNYEYWLNRGISEEIIKEFRGGLCLKDGKMKNRFVFPIFNDKNNIIGLSGRDVTNKGKIKWKHLGIKGLWIYPTFLNRELIKEKKEVILVESIGNCLSLWECGIKNVIVLFGTQMNLAILNLLIKFNINKIIIALDNDINQVGQNAAIKLQNRLKKYFDWYKIKIVLPPVKDFNVLLQERGKQGILDWRQILNHFAGHVG